MLFHSLMFSVLSLKVEKYKNVKNIYSGKKKHVKILEFYDFLYSP